jgi:4-carboxymuconolactone decarboxylase
MVRRVARLRPLSRAELDDDQVAVWDQITTTRRRGSLDLVDDHGGLIGPFNAMVHAPGIGRHLASLGAALRFESSLDRRLIEIATCAVGGYWRSEFELWAHRPLAVAAGVDPDAVAALASGDDPIFEDVDEAVVFDVTRQLLRTGRCDDATFARAHALLGDRGLVELTSLIGYYCAISLLLNMFEVPAPPTRR